MTNVDIAAPLNIFVIKWRILAIIYGTICSMLAVTCLSN